MHASGVHVNIGFAKHYRHCFGPRRTQSRNFAIQCLGYNDCRIGRAVARDNKPWRAFVFRWCWRRLVGVEHHAKRGQRNGACCQCSFIRRLPVCIFSFPQCNVHGPVGAIKFAVLLCAIEWVDNPYAVGRHAVGIVGCFLRQHRVVWSVLG